MFLNFFFYARMPHLITVAFFSIVVITDPSAGSMMLTPTKFSVAQANVVSTKPKLNEQICKQFFLTKINQSSLHQLSIGKKRKRLLRIQFYLDSSLSEYLLYQGQKEQLTIGPFICSLFTSKKLFNNRHLTHKLINHRKIIKNKQLKSTRHHSNLLKGLDKKLSCYQKCTDQIRNSLYSTNNKFHLRLLVTKNTKIPKQLMT